MKRKRLSIKQFKELAHEKKLPQKRRDGSGKPLPIKDGDSHVVLAKQFVGKFEADGDSQDSLLMTISSGARDRHGDTINARGWLLDHYKRNPVVLWSHESWNPPVGKGPEVYVAERSEGEAVLKQRIQFTSKDLYEFGDQVRRMLLAGFLNAASVGFMPLEWTMAEDVDGFFMPVDFQLQELLENSIVPVPANPEALMDGARKGVFDVKTVRRWVERSLDEGEEQRVFVPRKQIEDFYSLLSDKPVTVDAPEPSAKQVNEPEPPTSDDPVAAFEAAEKAAKEHAEKAGAAVATLTNRLNNALDAFSKYQLAYGKAELDDEALQPMAEAWLRLSQAMAGSEKAGRVLSTANETRLREARELLDKVLGQLDAGGDEPGDQPASDGGKDAGHGDDWGFDFTEEEIRSDLERIAHEAMVQPITGKLY